MAGLDSIKHFDEGGTTGEAGTITATAPQTKGALNISGKIAMDPTQTDAILAQMQKLISEREDPLNKIMGGVNRAYASTYGPQALLATQRQQDLQEKDTMDYRQQMAAYRAAQAQAAGEASRYNQVNQAGAAGAAGAAGTAGGTYFPPGIQRQIDMAGTIPEKKAIEAKWLNTLETEKLKHDQNVELDKLVPYVIGGREEQITLRDAIEFAKKNPSLPRNKAILEQADAIGVAPKAIAPTTPASTAQMKAEMKATVVPLEGLPTPFYAQESGSGKADTAKPGIQGAQGPMQVTQDTLDTYKRKGIVPKEYELSDPGQAYAAGVLIINDLHKKHAGDINKVAAEYHGGPGAINADGSINVGRKDALGTSVGDYVNQIRKRMNLPPVELSTTPATVAPAVTATPAAPTAAAPITAEAKPAVSTAAAPVATAETAKTPPAAAASVIVPAAAGAAPKKEPTLAEVRAEQKIKEEAGIAEQKKTAEDIALQRAGVVEAGKTAPERKASINYLNGLIEDPKTARAFGVIMKPGVLNAVLTIAEQGANVGNFGAVGIAGINDAVRKAMPNASQPEIDAAQKATREFALMQLAAAKVYLKGQGAVSDAERGLIRELAGSVKNSPAALRDFLKWSQMRADFDEKVGSAYTTFNQNNRNVSFERFLETPEYNKAKKEYETNLNAFSSAGVRESTKTPHPGVSLLDKYPPKVK